MQARDTLPRSLGRVRDAVSAHGISAVKAAVAGVLAWVLAGELLPSGSDFYAPLVAVLSVHPTVARTLRDSMQRLAGVAVGLALGFAVSATMGLRWWSLGLILTVAVLASTWRRLGAEGVQVPVAALLVLLLAEHPSEYAVQLIGEGLIGALTAAVLNAVVLPPLQTSTAGAALTRLRQSLGDLVDDMSAGIGGNWPPAEPDWVRRSLHLDVLVSEARDAVHQGAESTLFNPRGRRLRGVPEHQRQTLDGLEQLTRAVRDLAATLEEAADPDGVGMHVDPVFRPPLAAALHSLADALTSYGDPETPAEAAAEERPVVEVREQVDRLRSQLAGLESSRVPSLLAEGAVVTELARAVRILARAPLHDIRGCTEEHSGPRPARTSNRSG